jgi:site-specific recombinase XerD
MTGALLTSSVHRDGSAPLSPTSLHKTFTAGVRQRGLPDEASIHPLRHSDATPLLERGVSRRVMQAGLGPKHPRTTARSTPRTPPPLAVVHATLNALMAAL